MDTRYAAVALVLLWFLASCSSSGAAKEATSTAPSTAAPSTTAAVVSTTAPAKGTARHWQLEAKPGVPEKKCGAPDQCVLLGTETATVSGDLQGTSFVGTSGAFAKGGKFVVGRTDVFRGTVKGCGTGTLVFVGTELADLQKGSGEWRIFEGFGTGDLAHVTGHGTGRGTVDAAGFHSQWEGVIDCGN